ncbi:hypothetical protein Tco_0518934 [Tanacetum coccineum]
MDGDGLRRMNEGSGEVCGVGGPEKTHGLCAASTIPVSATRTTATTTIADEVEMNLAQTLIEIKSIKPKAKGIVMQEPSESTPKISSQQPSQVKGQGSKDKEELQAKLEEEERLAKQKEEDANVAEWDDVQAMMDADYELAARLQAEEQGELTVEEKSKLFVELMDKRKKHFARLRVEEQRRKPPTKAQKRNQMYTFVPMDSEVVKGSKDKAEGNETIAQESLKRAEEVAIDAIPLATKPLSIVDWKIIKEGKIGYFQIIKADGSSRRYSSMIEMLRNFDRDNLETLWKLIKAKHGNTRPEEEYERVLYGDLKTMFEPDVESLVWRNLQGHKVKIWKLFDSCGVHFVRFINLHIFMLVEKRYPLTPATITDMLNKKL